VSAAEVVRLTPLRPIVLAKLVGKSKDRVAGKKIFGLMIGFTFAELAAECPIGE
jgi:hypothetical protein